MSADKMSVAITLNAAQFEGVMRRVSRVMADVKQATKRLGRALWRAHLTPGERHIDRVCKEILAGKPGRPAEIRLLAAADFAAVLDGKAGIR